MLKDKKKFEVGDRLYLSFDDGSVEGYTLIEKEQRYYYDDDNKRVNYEMLYLHPDNKDLADGLIEDYNAIADGLEEDDEMVLKYIEEHKKKKMISLKDACEYIEGLFEFLNANGHQFKTKFIVDNFRRVMEEKISQ